MITASPRFRYYFAFALLLLLGVLLRLSAHGQEGPASLPARTSAYTRYLTQALQLRPHQYGPVYQVTHRYLLALDSLAAQPGTRPVDFAGVENNYAAAVHPLLTPGQFSAFVVLRQQPATNRLAESLAVGGH